MKRSVLWTGVLVLALGLGFMPGQLAALGDKPCSNMAFTLRVHNQTGHTIEVICMVYDLCNNRGGAVQQVKEVSRASTLEITWSGDNYPYDSKTYVKFKTQKLVNAGALKIHNHVDEKYESSKLAGSHDVYLNENLQIMPY